jgi:uncharacterized membrane protein YtjA (UPF0391 family)
MRKPVPLFDIVIVRDVRFPSATTPICVAPFLQNSMAKTRCWWRDKEGIVLYYALVFLVLGLVAGALGVSGVAAIASQIAWVLFIVGLVLMVVHFISGRRTLAP